MSEQKNQNGDTFIVVVMGVSGCGKSTVAEHLAEKIDAHFKDGDELHPRANIERMSQGIPLTDQDREPWLQRVRAYAADVNQQGQHCVIACSALKKSYRDILRAAGDVWIVHLTGTQKLIASRMHNRSGHFMPESLLSSQIADLEIPEPGEQAVTVGIDASVEEVASAAAVALRDCTAFAQRYPMAKFAGCESADELEQP